MNAFAAAAADEDGDEINALRARVAELEARLNDAPQPPVKRAQQEAAQKDAVFEASIDFIGALTGMEPPSIEAAPPEIFKPFRDFTERVLTIFHDERQSPRQPLTPLVERAQDEQPAYAWSVTGSAHMMFGEFAEQDTMAEAARCGGDAKAIPLYTHPQPPRQPLTDEQINAVITEQWGGRAIHAAHRAFARAIERAHGIGDKK